jgi:hypothetical protein
MKYKRGIFVKKNQHIFLITLLFCSQMVSTIPEKISWIFKSRENRKFDEEYSKYKKNIGTDGEIREPFHNAAVAKAAYDQTWSSYVRPVVNLTIALIVGMMFHANASSNPGKISDKP